MAGSAKTSGNSDMTTGSPCPQECGCLACAGSLQVDVVGTQCTGTGTGLGAGLECPCLFTGSILMVNCNDEFLSVEFNCETGDITFTGPGCSASGTLTAITEDPALWSGPVDFSDCCPGCTDASVVVACV